MGNNNDRKTCGSDEHSDNRTTNSVQKRKINTRYSNDNKQTNKNRRRKAHNNVRSIKSI